MSDQQRQMIEALRAAGAWPHATGDIRVVETHISFVLLTGSFAYKIKKAITLPFLDFSSLAGREHFCREEVRLNRRLAPELYLDVISIGGEPARPRIGATPAIEYAVKMRQFDDATTADRLLADGRLALDELTALATRIAEFHASLASDGPDDPAARAALIRENLQELRAALDGRKTGIDAIATALEQRLTALAPRLAARASGAGIRECHGDLHLGNVARVDGRLLPFDCLEFDQALRRIDVIDEAAFLYMDLLANGRRDLASAFIDRYVAASGDYAGLELLRLYVAHRALVRAKVAALGPDADTEDVARRRTAFLDCAAAALATATPTLLLTTGLSGSGKTFVGRHLVPALGAVQIRSDVERKRLHALAPGDRSGDGIGTGLYSPTATAATYTRLLEAAEAALAGGIDVIVDAACLERRRRRDFSALAARLGARFLLLYCDAPESVLRERIESRSREGRDASDADTAVLAHQQQSLEAIGPDEAAQCLRIDTSARFDVAALTAAIRERCGETA